MKSALRLLVSCLFLKFVIVMPVSAQTESDEAPQDMQQVLEMLKKQGVDEESLKDMEAVFEALSEVGAEQEASETASEKAAFLAATKGNGSATVELAGKQFEFTVTECEIRDRSITRYQVSAEQVPGEGDGSFSLSSDGVQTRGAFSLSDGDLGYLETQDQSHAVLAENQISWTGEAIDSNQIAVPIAVKITCGGEMMDYAANAETVPSLGANQVRMTIGEEEFRFAAGFCSTKEFRTGNLIVEFGLTATGTFRGEPAAILLSRSHPAGSSQVFQDLDLYLTDLTEEQRALSPIEAAEQVRDAIDSVSNEQHRVANEIYQSEMAAITEEYGESPPPDKMMEVMDAYTKVGEKHGEELDRIRDEIESLRPPQVRSFGTVTLNGNAAHFGGPEPIDLSRKPVPAFENLSGAVNLWVTCPES